MLGGRNLGHLHSLFSPMLSHNALGLPFSAVTEEGGREERMQEGRAINWIG